MNRAADEPIPSTVRSKDELLVMYARVADQLQWNRQTFLDPANIDKVFDTMLAIRTTSRLAVFRLRQSAPAGCSYHD